MPRDLLIVGGGPAGYTAAIYAARAARRPLLAEGFAPGGLLAQTTEVENYPAFPSILGPDLMAAMRAHALGAGAEIISEEVTALRLSDGGLQYATLGEREITARAVILAMGATPRRLGIPGENSLSGRGVSYCATCDGPFFRDRRVAVIGGGDSALEEALYLSRLAAHVTVIHRRALRASAVMIERVRATPNIELLTPYVALELIGDERLQTLRLRHSANGSELLREAAGCFVAIGHHPTSQLLRGQVALDADGYVLLPNRPATATSKAGVFAAGDLTDRIYRQAVTAAGSGAQAALDADRYLRE